MNKQEGAGSAVTATPQPDAAQGWVGGRLWHAFHRTHLHDYGPGATRLWLSVAFFGFCALGISIAKLAQLPANDLLQILGWIAITAVAAAFPLQIPRTKYSIATCDVVIFL